LQGNYQSAGAILLGFGAVLSIVSYSLLQNIPLTALGLGSVIVGIASLMLPPNPIPSSLVREMLQNSATNIEAVLEEFGVKGKAMYLPPREGRVTAFITLEERPVVEIASSAGEVPLRVLSMASGSRGVTIFPPGSELPKSQEAHSEGSNEDFLRTVLVDTSELVRSVKSNTLGDTEVVEIKGAKSIPNLPRFNHCLGSLPSSIAASALAYKTGRRVVIDSEDVNGTDILLILRTFGQSADRPKTEGMID
jgi:hypothetical protein